MVKSCNLTGVLVVLDAHPGGIIYQDMILDYVQIVRTIYEGMFCHVPIPVTLTLAKI
jgi:hypothetical protein